MTTRDTEPDPLDPYRAAEEVHGSGFEATLWASEKTQRLRFDVLVEMLGPSSIRDKVIIDLGCGDGALAAHLEATGVQPRRYIGIDGLLAQARAGEERGYDWADFVCADLLTSGGSLGRFGADIALISGTLNTMSEAQSRVVVMQAFKSVRDAVAFNILSDRPTHARIGSDTGPAIRQNVVGWVDYALGITPLVAFRQDHLEGHDGAIMLRHELAT
jgi:SAM-dependent methyltransferase